ISETQKRRPFSFRGEACRSKPRHRRVPRVPDLMLAHWNLLRYFGQNNLAFRRNPAKCIAAKDTIWCWCMLQVHSESPDDAAGWNRAQIPLAPLLKGNFLRGIPAPPFDGLRAGFWKSMS